MPNIVAYAALAVWPVVVYLLCRSLPRPTALLASILGGYLLLPHAVGVDFPLLPSFDKNTITALAFVLCLVITPPPQGQRRPVVASDGPIEQRRRPDLKAQRDPIAPPPTSSWTRGLWIERVLLAMLVIGPMVTVLQNSEPIFAGGRLLAAMTMYDLLSILQGTLITILPYLLARHFLRRNEDHVLLLKALVVAALMYSLLALIEIRLSPQMSNWVYGFLAQSFAQAVRDGGYRPVVFLQHGLWLAIFFAMALTAAFALWRQVRIAKWMAAGVWLLLVLALSRSLGALAIAVLAAPIVLFLKPKSQLIVAGALALVILLYPALRSANLIPLGEIVGWAESISADRGQSLTFRLDNEDQLLARANERPLSGWGSWGRGRIYDDSGKDISITDGMWIIMIGDRGWLGYIAQFGLLTLPLISLAVRRRSDLMTPAIAGLGVVLCVNLVDLIPNATLTPITWLVAGALMGALRNPPPSDGAAVPEAKKAGRRAFAYSRAR